MCSSLLVLSSWIIAVQLDYVAVVKYFLRSGIYCTDGIWSPICICFRPSTYIHFVFFNLCNVFEYINFSLDTVCVLIKNVLSCYPLVLVYLHGVCVCGLIFLFLFGLLFWSKFLMSSIGMHISSSLIDSGCLPWSNCLVFCWYCFCCLYHSC